MLSRVVIGLLEPWNPPLLFKLFEDAKCHQCHQPLAVWRTLPDIDAIVPGSLFLCPTIRVLLDTCYAACIEPEADRIDLLAARFKMALEINQIKQTIRILHDFDDRLGNLSSVEASLATLCKQPKRVCESRIREQFAGPGSPPSVLCRGIPPHQLAKVGRRSPQPILFRLPLAATMSTLPVWAPRRGRLYDTYEERRHFGNRKAFLCQLDGRSKNLVQCQLVVAEKLDCINPACSCTRSGDGMDAGHWYPANDAVFNGKFGADELQRGLGGSTSGSIDATDLFLVGRVEQGKHITTKAC